MTLVPGGHHEGGIGFMQDGGIDGVAPHAFQPRTERQMTVLVHAGISQLGRDGLCRVRNVSVGGIAIETSLPLIAGEPALVTLTSGRELPCDVRWVRDGKAGMSCETDPTTLLNEDRAERAIAVPGPAAVRFYRMVPTQIGLNGRTHRCTLDSLSTTDILLTGAPDMAVGMLLTIDLGGLGSLPATAVICKDGDLFAKFTPPLPFRLMDEWLAVRR